MRRQYACYTRIWIGRVTYRATLDERPDGRAELLGRADCGTWPPIRGFSGDLGSFEDEGFQDAAIRGVRVSGRPHACTGLNEPQLNGPQFRAGRCTRTALHPRADKGCDKPGMLAGQDGGQRPGGDGEVPSVRPVMRPVWRPPPPYRPPPLPRASTPAAARAQSPTCTYMAPPGPCSTATPASAVGAIGMCGSCGAVALPTASFPRSSWLRGRGWGGGAGEAELEATEDQGQPLDEDH
jgi:hypothetical protein